MYLENGKFLFDKENCESCYQEVLAWDWEQHQEEILKLYNKKYNHTEFMDFSYSKHSKGWVAHPNKRLCKDPAKDRLYKRRKGDKFTTGHFAHKENYNETRQEKRRFRGRMKQNLLNEEYYNLRPRDYHTYGWNTW